MTPTKKIVDVASLSKLMSKSFSLGELDMLCAELDVDFENISGETKSEKALALGRHLKKRKRLQDLLALCQRERPKRDWHSVYREVGIIPWIYFEHSRRWWWLTAVPLLLIGLFWWCTSAGCFCPYQADNDYDTIVQIIRAESQAANESNLAIIEDIFAADAYIVQADPNGDVTEWFDPLSHYGPLFDSTRFIGAMHTDISGAITGRTARFISGSQGGYVKNGERGEYSNAADNPNEQEIWELEKNFRGCWQITSLLFH